MSGSSRSFFGSAASVVVSNARTYGAVGDDTTDDTAAIQAAINAVPSTGGVVYLPAGTYKLTAALTVKSKLTIAGDGQYTTVLHQTSFTAQGLYGADIIGLTLRGLRITGPATGLSLGAVDGILLDQTGVTATQNIVFSDVKVDHFSRHGVNLADPITSVLANVRSQNNGGWGFVVALGTSIKLEACYANGCLTGGYSFTDTAYSELSACAADSTAAGYLLTTCNGVALTACGAEDISATGYRVDGGAGSTINSCYSSANNQVAYKITGGASRILLLNVRERNPLGSATASVQVDAGCTATVIQPVVTTPTSYATGTTRSLDSGAFDITSGGTSINGVDRAATTNYAAYVLRTGGSDRWALQMVGNATNDVQLTDSANGNVALSAEARGTAANLSLLTSTKSYGGGVGVVFVPNASTVPTSNPTGGGLFYVESGVLKFRGTSGSAVPLLAVGTTAGTVAAGDDSRITGAVPASLVDAKGDLPVGTADNTVGRLAVGTDGQVPMAYSGASTGLVYTRPVTEAMPADHGMLLWNYDPALAFGTAGAPTAGTLQIIRLYAPYAMPISNVLAITTNTPSGLTGVYGCLFDSAGAVISGSLSADQSTGPATAWNGSGSGLRTIPLGATKTVQAGPFAAAWWFTGAGTNPTFARASGTSTTHNAGQNNNPASSTAYRFATGATGLTASPPGTLATYNQSGLALWGGVS